MMQRRGFTLVELMLVVAILGILGALVLPVYQGHASEAKVSSAKSNLHAFRAQIELYKIQHGGYLPGYIGGSLMGASVVATQMEQTTDESGMPSGSRIVSGSYVCGPYLLKVPENPFNGESDVGSSTDFATDAGTAGYGWLYNATTGEIALNCAGTDEDGIAYIAY